MSDFDNPPVQIIPAGYGMAGATGPTGPPGGAGASFATRTAMAAYNPGTLNNGDPFYLSESGREGMFVVDTASNWTAAIAADTAQGLFVVSTAVPSKVYRRIVPSAKALATWWGVSPTASASANVTAYTAALAALYAIAPGLGGNHSGGYGFTAGSIGLHTPAGHYQINAEIPLKQGIDFTGDGGTGSDATIIIQTSATSHGIRLYAQPSPGVGDMRAYGTRIDGLYLKGAFSGTRGPYHGIYFSAGCTISNCFADNWPGSGFRGHANNASGENINSFHLENLWGQLCDWTVYVDGDNANAGVGTNIKGEVNRFGTVFDDSFLGNTWLGGLCEGSGTTTGFLTRCEKSGHIYTVKYGQETWCSTNAPSGTTASNTGWIYWTDGSPTASCPTWTTGQTWYFAAANACNPDDPGNTRSVFTGFYHEPGVNPVIMPMGCTYIPAQFNGTPILFFDGTPFAAIWTYNNTTVMGNDAIVARNFYSYVDMAWGHAASLSPTPAPADRLINWENTNFYHQIQARYWNAGAPTNIGLLTFARNFGILLNSQISGGQVGIQYNGTTITNTGIDYHRPGSDNAINLGGAGQRWKEIFAANATINTSDERDKQAIAKPNDAILDAWADVDWHQYQFKDAVKTKGKKARTHVGLVSQRIEDVFKKHKLDPFALGLLCYDKWEDQVEPVFEEVEVLEQAAGEDEEGNPRMVRVKKHQPKYDKKGVPVTKVNVRAGERYGIRYTEALALEAALQRRRADRMEARLAKLEEALK